MPFRRIFVGRQFSVYAWSREDGRCEIEDFLTVLEQNSPSDWVKLVALILKTANDGRLSNREVCPIVRESNGLYEFVSAGGACIVWFFSPIGIIVCSGYVRERGELERRESIETALVLKEHFEEKRYD